MSMVIRDRGKIEHVPSRCWDFFTTWCKPSERYKNLFLDGKPNGTEIELQKDCSRNKSMAHNTISHWRRNAEMFVMHQCVLERDPFNIDTWLVVTHLTHCKYASTTGGTGSICTIKVGWQMLRCPALVSTTNGSSTNKKRC